MEPTPPPRPQPQTPPSTPPPAPAPAAVTPGVPVGWGAPPPAASLPDEDAGRKRLTLAILIVLIVAALGVAVWTFGPWKNNSTPSGPVAPQVSLSDIEKQLHDIDGQVDDIDANMVGVDPSLNDVQGDLTE